MPPFTLLQVPLGQSNNPVGRYGLPQQIYTSKIYPLTAPNGSTIIVCGHDQGLLILWRGGRPFKTATGTRSNRSKFNGTSNEISTELDSKPDGDAPEFEDEEEEVDPSKPFQPIIQHLDLPLGTAVLHLSFPRLPYLSHQAPAQLSPKLLRERLVLAVGCSDCTVRILTVPLSPPSPQSKARPELREKIDMSYAGQGAWDEQMITIPNTLGHRNPPAGVRVAFSLRTAIAAGEAAIDGDDDDGDDGDDINENHEDEWDLILASHSADLNGTFLVHRIPVTEDGFWLEEEVPDNQILWRSQQLAAPAVSMDLHVSTHADQPRYPRILLGERNGAVRIFDCCSASGREQGSWALSLYPALQTSAEGVTQHKRLLDAAWVFSGKAVTVLAVDGEWGIWNISYETTNTASAAKKNLVISGGSHTKFTLSGWIGSTPVSGSASKASSTREQKTSNLAPMTPGTRRVRQEALFTGSTPRSSFSTSGGIGVYNTGKTYGGKEDDETVVFWHGDKISMIASVQAYWQNKIKGSGNLFGTGLSGQLRDIANVNLSGERRTAVSIFPVDEGLSASGVAPKQPEILISGERSFVVVAPPLSGPEVSSTHRTPHKTVIEDQELLAHGELDVDGMDRILEGMSNGIPQRLGGLTNSLASKRKVLFASPS